MLFFLLVMVVIVAIWCKQFAFLMSLNDAELGARNDKILWCAAFILLPFAAPFAFIMWRTVRIRTGADSR